MLRDPLNKKSNRFRFKPRRSDRLDRGFSHAYMNPLSTMRGKPTFKSSGQVMPSFTSGGYGSSGYSFARHQQRIFEQRSYGGIVSIIVVAAVIVVALIVGRHIAITPNAISVAADADSQAAAQRASAFGNYLPAYSLGAIGRIGAAEGTQGNGATSDADSGGQPSPSGESGASGADSQLLVIVSANSPLPSGWSVERSSVTSDSTMASAAAQRLRTMVANMEEAGLSPTVVSAYRSSREESELFAQEVTRLEQQGLSESDAQAQASEYVAAAGTSEHETGLAVDIVASDIDLSDGLSADLASQVAATPEALWLAQHCAEYGFVIRYPADKVDQTGVAFEPWHLRYVGIQAASEMAASGQCLEEYVAARDAAATSAGDAESASEATMTSTDETEPDEAAEAGPAPAASAASAAND